MFLSYIVHFSLVFPEAILHPQSHEREMVQRGGGGVLQLGRGPVVGGWSRRHPVSSPTFWKVDDPGTRRGRQGSVPGSVRHGPL